MASMITLSEESRRMEEMMKMYGMSGLDLSLYAAPGTLVLNANHPLVKYIAEHEDGNFTNLICRQLYDLAKLTNKPLTSDEMTAFIQRTNNLMLQIVK